jgi:hypothetical protein
VSSMKIWHSLCIGKDKSPKAPTEQTGRLEEVNNETNYSGGIGSHAFAG